MQQNKKGSILLYTLFLSSFLILFFVSFQGELEKMLEGAKNSEKHAEELSHTQDALILLKNTPSAQRSIETNEHLSLISLFQSGSIFTQSLGGSDPGEYWITSTGWSASLSLAVIQGWPISYRIAAFNSGSELSSVLISSGVMATSGVIPLSLSLDTHILFVDPLWGFARFTIDSSATILPPSGSYRLERDINGYKQDEWIHDILYFLPKSRANFGYEKMSMYLR